MNIASFISIVIYTYFLLKKILDLIIVLKKHLENSLHSDLKSMFSKSSFWCKGRNAKLLNGLPSTLILSNLLKIHYHFMSVIQTVFWLNLYTISCQTQKVQYQLLTEVTIVNLIKKCFLSQALISAKLQQDILLHDPPSKRLFC